MSPFLQQFAKQLIENHNANFENVCVILPNRRAILYLKKYLSELLHQPTFAPKMWSIDDFVFETTHLQRCEKVDLLFELFEIHRNIAADKARSFDSFIQWGDIILNDFGDIDAFLVNANEIFSYLTEAQAIKLWNIDGSPLTEKELDYLDFYKSLSTYYNLLREKVLQNNTAWTQLAIRLFCEKFDDFFRPFQEKSFYIIGFNALTTAEETLFKLIQKNANTKIIWDFDEYYLQQHHEAGLFLRENFKTFGKPNNIEDYQFFKQKKEIHIYGISKNIGQTLQMSHILQNSAKFNSEETAIILNDETLLTPALNALPDSCTNFNITMSYPLKNTQLYECIDTWLTIHTTACKNNNQFYFKDLFKFLQHPITQRYINSTRPQNIDDISKSILKFQESSIPFLTSEDIRDKIFSKNKTLFNTIENVFIPWNNSLANAIIGLLCLIENLKQVFENEGDTLNSEYSFQIFKTINRLQEMTHRFSNIDTGVQSIKLIFNQIFHTISIPFAGEPLNGLQIMGLLESRLLDFKNIIMLSVNEGLIPSNSFSKTLIPFDIRKNFNLPTISEENAIVAYHFYRLLQRSDTIHLLYNSANSSTVGSNEKSRYITQLAFELPKYNPNISVIEHPETIPNISQKQLLLPIIKKDENIVSRLDEIAQKGFSPSSINLFLECRLKFYFSNILEISEPDELKEEVDAALLGKIVHKVLENLHAPFINRKLEVENVDILLKKVEDELESCFETMWQGGNYRTGRNNLLYHVAKQWIISFLKYEKDLCRGNYVVMEQEVQLEQWITINSNGTEKKVKIKGIVDRICRENGIIKIIDFKTGKIEDSDVEIKDFNGFLDNCTKKPKAAIQLFIYLWLYSLSTNNTQPLAAAIISLQKLSKKFELTIEKETTISNEILQQTETLLKNIVEEIFDKNQPFAATDDHKTCQYCDFFELCRWKNAKNLQTNED